mmetsp:Transcript_8378/g.20865  ORF Transcript_8378/g.20865 Transcript_8378/m.20865 type:complete len:563 (-) Transcript_8378:1267-2955(-)
MRFQRHAHPPCLPARRLHRSMCGPDAGGRSKVTSGAEQACHSITARLWLAAQPPACRLVGCLAPPAKARGQPARKPPSRKPPTKSSSSETTMLVGACHSTQLGATQGNGAPPLLSTNKSHSHARSGQMRGQPAALDPNTPVRLHPAAPPTTCHVTPSSPRPRLLSRPPPKDSKSWAVLCCRKSVSLSVRLALPYGAVPPGQSRRSVSSRMRDLRVSSLYAQSPPACLAPLPPLVAATCCVRTLTSARSASSHVVCVGRYRPSGPATSSRSTTWPRLDAGALTRCTSEKWRSPLPASSPTTAKGSPTGCSSLALAVEGAPLRVGGPRRDAPLPPWLCPSDRLTSSVLSLNLVGSLCARRPLTSRAALPPLAPLLPPFLTSSPSSPSSPPMSMAESVGEPPRRARLGALPADLPAPALPPAAALAALRLRLRPSAFISAPLLVGVRLRPVRRPSPPSELSYSDSLAVPESLSPPSESSSDSSSLSDSDAQGSTHLGSNMRMSSRTQSLSAWQVQRVAPASLPTGTHWRVAKLTASAQLKPRLKPLWYAAALSTTNSLGCCLACM